VCGRGLLFEQRRLATPPWGAGSSSSAPDLLSSQRHIVSLSVAFVAASGAHCGGKVERILAHAMHPLYATVQLPIPVHTLRSERDDVLGFKAHVKLSPLTALLYLSTRRPPSGTNWFLHALA
jgi:hypothetical protein